MKRRGFLSALTGAAIAGPAVAKQAAQIGSGAASVGSASALGHNYPSMATSRKSALIGGSYKDNLMERAAELRRAVMGERTEDEIEQERIQNYNLTEKFRAETAALKSMSQSSKVTRNGAHQRARDEQSHRFMAKMELSRVLKELAGMGS